MAKLDKTPSGLRTHIGVFGKTNSGKSSLINTLVGQDISIVSEESGTTTDPVYKAMELNPIGPVLFIDTAGLEDVSSLGDKRMERTNQVMDACDVALVLFMGEDFDTEKNIVSYFKKNNTPYIPIVTYASDDVSEDRLSEIERVLKDIEGSSHAIRVSVVDCLTGDGIDELKKRIIDLYDPDKEPSILRDLVGEGDLVMLIMPQDKQAPKGRLILPQVTTLRELLDKHVKSMCVTPDEMDDALSVLKEPPKLIITDSQVFDYVYERTPEKSLLTSFSVLYAALKGDVDVYVRGARAIGELKAGDRVLVAESCTHAPMDEDIGRVKIPNLLRKKVGGDIEVDVYAGKDFPDDLDKYSLILQCGGCVVNRRSIMSRIARAEAAGVPMTNYGIAIAYLKGILDKIVM